MNDKEFLTDVAKRNNYKIIKNKLNLIDAPCGCGKTTYFFNELTTNYLERKRILYLVDTNMLEKSMVNEHGDKVEIYEKQWFEDLEIALDLSETKIRTMSYHKFGYLIKKDNSLLEKIDLIVIDEAHNLLKYSDMDRECLSKNYKYADAEDIKRASELLSGCSYLAHNLTRFIDEYDTDFVLMTATPQRILEHKPYSNYLYDVLQGYKLKGYNIEKEAHFDNIKNAFKFFEGKNKEEFGKILVYSKTIKSCSEIEEGFRRIGYSPITLWSEKNEESPMTNEQILARNEVIKYQKIPDLYNVLIINDAYQTGWNLENFEDITKHETFTVVINTTDKDTIVQVRGRIRHNIRLLFSKDNSLKTTITEVPIDFLDRPLVKKDKDELVQYYNIVNSLGRQLKWASIKNLILESEKYTVLSKNVKGKRFDIIQSI